MREPCKRCGQLPPRQRDACPECGSTAKTHFCPGKDGMEPKAWTSEADETPTIRTEEDDNA